MRSCDISTSEVNELASQVEQLRLTAADHSRSAAEEVHASRVWFRWSSWSSGEEGVRAFRRACNLVPWGTLALAVGSVTHELLLCRTVRLQARRTVPLVFALPFAEEQAKGLARFRELMQESDRSTKYDGLTQAEMRSDRFKAKWWSTRRRLDRELGDTLQQLESSCFSILKVHCR
jgi:Peptidase family C50